jgi:hypothetical protein
LSTEARGGLATTAVAVVAVLRGVWVAPQDEVSSASLQILYEKRTHLFSIGLNDLD